MPIKIFGIDFSGDASMWSARCTRSNVWVAEGHVRNGAHFVDDLRPIQRFIRGIDPFGRLSQLLNDTQGFAAIDAPFSVPASLTDDAEALWQMVKRLPKEGRPFARGAALVNARAPELGPRGKKLWRETEEHWRAQRVNVRSTMWCGLRGGAPFAVACMTLLASHKGAVWPIRQRDAASCALVEAFPAAQLRHWGLPFIGYNGAATAATDKRSTILRWLKDERGLNVRSEVEEEECLRSADALDAVICMYAASATATGRLKITCASQVEGLIAIHA
jgi:hypothetical protein